MKQLTALAFCLFAAGTLFAQNNAAQQKNAPPQKSATVTKGAAPQNAATGRRGALRHDGPAVGGFILDKHRHPIADVQAFIYAKDSSIIASGFTDATGHYETNAVMPGSYVVKIVYPTSKVIMVSGVVIKKGISPLSISADPPAADTSLPYTNFAPIVEKKKPGAAGMPKKK